MDDVKYIHYEKLNEQAAVYLQERNNLDNLKYQIIRAKRAANGNDQWQYDRLIERVERLAAFMDSMSKAAENTAADATELSRRITVMSQDILFTNQRTFSNAFQGN